MKAQRYLNYRLKGFTLIELLIVIAIIAIIAAILFPVFASAREKARQASCQSNEKQMGLAFAQYVQDFDEVYPFASGDTAVDRAWDEEIYPYVKLKTTSIAVGVQSIEACPDDQDPRNTGNSIRSYAMAGGQQPGYGCPTECVSCEQMAACMTNDPNGTTNKDFSAGRLVSQIPDPSGTILLVEHPCDVNNMTGAGSEATCDRPITGANADSTGDNGQYGQDCEKITSDLCTVLQQPYHNGGWDYLFDDGHVKWLLPEQTIGAGLNNSGASTRWNGTTTTTYTCSISSPCGMWTITDGD